MRRKVYDRLLQWKREKDGTTALMIEGAFSVSNSHVDAVVAYIKGQEEHHKKVSFQDELRRICELYNVNLDERYAWD